MLLIPAKMMSRSVGRCWHTNPLPDGHTSNPRNRRLHGELKRAVWPRWNPVHRNLAGDKVETMFVFCWSPATPSPGVRYSFDASSHLPSLFVQCSPQSLTGRLPPTGSTLLGNSRFWGHGHQVEPKGRRDGAFLGSHPLKLLTVPRVISSSTALTSHGC